jgi:hypothetical protein
MKKPNVHVLDNFVTEYELNKILNFLSKETWRQEKNDPHYSTNINSTEMGVLAENIRNRLKLKIENIFNCRLNNAPFGTFIKYKNGAGLELHDDSKLYKKAYGKPTIDISSTIYITENFTGGEIYFPKYNMRYSPKSGSVIIFPSSKKYKHQVFEVNDGDRIMASIFWHKV